MSKRTCSIADCERAHRARGLCASHYNQVHAPNRHKAKLVKCTICGVEVSRTGGGGRKYGHTCSTLCRSMLNGRLAPRTALPRKHWALWFGRSSQWPKSGWKVCDHCDSRFPATHNGQKYCSESCSWKMAWRRRLLKAGGTPEGVMAEMVRQCERCGEGYTSPYVNRVHCTDLCRDRDAQDRGVVLSHGWISPAVREFIYERDGYMCWLCDGAVDMNDCTRTGDWSPSLDHVTPRSKGGTHDESNLKTAHRWCNSVRGNSDPMELFAPVLAGE